MVEVVASVATAVVEYLFLIENKKNTDSCFFLLQAILTKTYQKLILLYNRKSWVWRESTQYPFWQLLVNFDMKAWQKNREIGDC